MSTKPAVLATVPKTQEQPRPLTAIERAVVRRGHPRAMIVHLVGAIWAFYFLWVHNWIFAVVTVVVSGILGRILTTRMNTTLYARTVFGKLMLVHLNPFNVIVQLVGCAYLLYGVWTHAAVPIMIARSVVLIGHLWGWKRVHDAF